MVICTVYDWDDTCCPTYHLEKFGNKDPSSLQKIEENISKLLHKALSYGETYIITNAHKDWVYECIKLYFPSLSPLMEKVKLYSSVNLGFSETYHVSLWKTKVFDFILGENFYDPGKHQLICIGDNMYDRDAALTMASYYPHITVKSIKFYSRPTMELLQVQQSLFHDHFDLIVNHSIHMDLTVQIYNDTVKKEFDQIIEGTTEFVKDVVHEEIFSIDS